MHNAERIEEAYRIANTITTFVQSLYTDGKYSELYKNIYSRNPIELKTMPEYFPFLPYSYVDFGAFELLRNVILFHSEHGSKITTLQEIYSTGVGYHYDQLHLATLIDLGLIKLAPVDKLQRLDEVYIHVLSKDVFMQAYKNAIVSHLLKAHMYKHNDHGTIHLSSRVSDYMSSASYMYRAGYTDKLNYCIAKVNTYWTSKSNKYLGAGDADLFFPFMVEAERRLLLLTQYKTKTNKKNKDLLYTFSLRDLDPHKDVLEKYQSILALIQMGFISCVNRINNEKWYFNLDTKFKVMDTGTVSDFIYPTWMTKYICSVPSHLDRFNRI